MSNPSSNELPDGFDALIDLSDDMIDGATEHGDEVGLKQWTADKLTTLRETAKEKKKDHDAALKAEGDVTTARKTANSNAKGFVATAQRMLIEDFGTKPSKAWEEV